MTLPETVFELAPCEIATPAPGFASAALPVASVPIQSPSTTLPDVPEPLSSSPVQALPEIRSRAPADVPPNVLLVAPPVTYTPQLFAIALNPLGPVPI